MWRNYFSLYVFFFFSSRRRHTRSLRDWSSDVCSSDLDAPGGGRPLPVGDDPAHGDPGAVAEVAQPGGGDDAQLVQAVADQGSGVAVRSDAGGPHVGDQLLGPGSAGVFDSSNVVRSSCPG